MLMSFSESDKIRFVELLSTPAANIDDVKVSKVSSVYSPVWDFTKDLKHRPRSIDNAALVVNWCRWPFSVALRKELQHVFCLYRLAPKYFSARESKPNSFCSLVSRSMDFLANVVRTFPSAELAESLDQFTWLDIDKAARCYSYSSDTRVKQGLKIIFNPGSAKVLEKTFCFGPQQIRRLIINSANSLSPEEALNKSLKGPEWMSDEFFSFLSDESSARVKDFLLRMGAKIEDACSCKYTAPEGVQGIKCFPQVFWLYEQLRRANKKCPISNETPAQVQYQLDRLEVRVGTLAAYLAEVNMAAQSVLAMYMGARFSELAEVEVGCLKEIDGMPCVVSRNFKGRPDSSNESDSWVAIPVMRDSVRVLELLARLKNNGKLFSSLSTAGGTSIRGRSVKNEGVGYSSGGFSSAMRKYIESVDKYGRFKGLHFSSHQFKHSLARQMIKAKLGLPYVSFHLKHLHSRVSTLPSDVTLGYGNAGKVLQSESAGLRMHEARRELAKKIFDPDSVVCGGAAAEFDERRKSFFKGMTDAGMTKEQIINELAAVASSSFVNVGLGYCTGRVGDSEVKVRPPCIGSLRCNPSQCANAIISKDAHGAAWRKMYEENKRMAEDARFSYGRTQFEAAADEARKVLYLLGEDEGLNVE